MTRRTLTYDSRHNTSAAEQNIDNRQSRARDPNDILVCLHAEEFAAFDFQAILDIV